jgi:hypothetical protein
MPLHKGYTLHEVYTFGGEASVNPLHVYRVGHNYLYTVYIRFIGRGITKRTVIYDAYADLANPTHVLGLQVHVFYLVGQRCSRLAICKPVYVFLGLARTVYIHRI